MNDDTEPSQQAPTTTDDIDNQIAALESRLGDRKAEATRAVEQKFKTVTKAELTAEMSSIFDKQQAKAEQETARQTVPQVPAKDLDEAFTNTAAWPDKTEAEHKTFQEGRTAVDDLKARARSMRVELANKEAVAIALQLDGNQKTAAPAILTELAPVLQTAKQLYPESNFHEVAANHLSWDRHLRNDPIQGVADLGSNSRCGSVRASKC